MELGVLGPLLVLGPDGGSVPVLGPRRRAMLAALAAHRGRTVRSDDLVDALWPEDPPPSARHSLHSHASRLRLEHGLPVHARDGGYALDLPAQAVDAERFDALVRRARGTDPTTAADLLGQALGMWRGPAYGASADLPLVRGEAQRLAELRRTAREHLVVALVGCGRHDEAVAAAEALAADLPARESAWAALVRALVAAGRPADGVEAYGRAVAALDELGLLPSAELRAAQTEALTAPDRAAEVVTARPERPGRTSATVPVVASSLVGRDQDVATVEALLDDVRLVTLVGPGGVGKTRLAFEVARRRGPRHASGVRVVELTTLTDVAQVPAAVVSALEVGTQGGPPANALRRAGELDVLVLLDNCEHVVDAVADVLDQLLAGGRARVLATSREPVGVPGERVHRVQPLPTAGPTGGHQLFLDRAAAAGVDADGLDPELVGRVVRRLDGLPLAIEMAAARTATLGLADLAHTLEHELGAAGLQAPGRRTAERHRTLGAVIAWSEALLDPRSRETLRRWPVFSGPVEAQDARAVVDAEPEQVEDLVRRSLLVLVPRAVDGRSQYRMLHTVRSAVAAGADLDHRRHAEHFLAAAEAADRLLRGPGEARGVARLGAVVAELRAAHAWARGADPVLAARLSRALHLFAMATLDDEIQGWAARLVPLLDGPGLATAHTGVAARLVKAGQIDAALRHGELALAAAVDDTERLQALEVLTDAPIYDGRFEECRRWATMLEALAEEAGDPYFGVQAAASFGLTLTYAGHPDAAREALADRRALLARHGDLSPTCTGWLEYTQGEIDVERDPATALRHLDRAVDLADAVGNRYLGGVARVSATSVRGRHGEPGDAVPAFVGVVRWWLDRADRTHLLTTLRNLVDLLVRLEEWDAAARLWGAVDHAEVSRSFGPERERLDVAREAITRRLGPGAADDVVAVGAGLSLEDAALDALRTLESAGRR